MRDGRTWNMWASKSRGTHRHIGAKRWVELHGLNDPVVNVLVQEWLGLNTAPEVTHYGWLDADKPQNPPSMIWPTAKTNPNVQPWLLLDMCFTYGMKAEIDRGRGEMVALVVTESP